MNTWVLPDSVQVGGVFWKIRTDFRIVIDVLIAFDNPEYDEYDKVLYCLMSLIEDFDNLPEKDYQEAIEELVKFIDMGINSEDDTKRNSRKIMDWEQDASLIIPAVNKVVGREIRADKYMHWWTFLASYMEIDGKSMFAQVVSIRHKNQKGIKLEKDEREFYRNNKHIIDLKRKLSDQEQAELDAFNELLGI